MDPLATTYLGLELRSPLVASSGPLTGRPDQAKAMQEAGAAAVVLPSLFEEEIAQHDVDLLMALEQGSEHFAEALEYFPAYVKQGFEGAADRYLRTLAETRERLDIPVIASLNATSAAGWVRYARLIEEAGAAALELNIYRVAADPDRAGASVEDTDLDVVRALRPCLSIPFAVKLSPYYSSMANMGRRVVEAGADGLVLFNRYYQPDLDADSREIVPSLRLSSEWELRLPLRWIAILRPQLPPRTALGVTSGVQTGTDVAKALLVGADVAMMTSAILRNGPGHFATVERELREWMDRNEYASVDELRGSVSYHTSDDPGAFERANYVRVLRSWTAPPGLEPGAPSS